MSSAGPPQNLPLHYDNPVGLSTRFTLRDSAIRPRVAALKVLPPPRPEPSAHAGDRLNLAFCAFEQLTHHLLSLSPTAKAWTELLMVQVIESLMAFVLYYVREIVLRGKIIDFRDTAGHKFHSYAMLLMQALLSHPFTKNDDPKSKASKTYERELKIFLASIVPALLVTVDMSSSDETASEVLSLFDAIKCLQYPERDPAWHDKLYQNFFQILDQNPAMNGVLAATFFIATNSFRGELMRRQQSEDVTAEEHRNTSHSIFSTYDFVTPLLYRPDDDDLYNRVLEGGFTRTTCELMSGVAQEARDVILTVADTRDKMRAFGAGISALQLLGQFLKMRLRYEGRVRVELALHHDVLYLMREFDRLFHELGSKNRNHSAMMTQLGSQLKLQDDFVQVVKPYLVYYDLLESVSRRALHLACPQESLVWKTFAREIESLEGDRTAFDEVYRESCQVQDCPHSYTKSPLQTALHRSPTTLSEDLQQLARAQSENRSIVFRCSGCRLVYYCSPKCQQSDWKEHKSVCASVKMDRKKTGGLTNVLSRRDITFMQTIACLTLSRHPPPDGLVQDMDFITIPPTLTLRSVDNVRYDDAKIVVGEKEIHKDVIRKRVLNYMRSQGEEVGIVYSRQFLPEDAEVVLTFVDWEMIDGQGLKYKRRG